MADGKVVVPPDSSGKAIDTSELTRSDGLGTVVERQRIVIGDPTDVNQFAGVTTSGALLVQVSDQHLLGHILGELKRIAMLLEVIADTHVGLNDII